MANWEELEGLKAHRTVIFIVVIVLLFVFIFGIINKFESHKSNIQYVDKTSVKELPDLPRVKSKQGLNIRAQTDVNSEVLISVPYYEHIDIITVNYKSDVINDESGYWYEVEYNGTKGYAWNKYIQEFED